MPDEINPYNAALRPASGSPFAPSPGEVSEVVYELDVEDLVELALHNQKRSRALRRQFVLARVILAVMGVGLLSLPLAGGFDPTVALVAFAAIAVLLLFLPQISRRRNRRILRKVFLEGSNRVLLGPRRLRLTPQAFVFSAELFDSAIKWPAVESIEADAEYAYFYIASIQANIVPRRAFNDDLQFAAFVELARRYWRQATGVPAANA
ncbi:MAG TPA: YcxB family protein [Pirellulales bacterium]|nr:YcxB family protein [Pirellulales bacterium]